MTPKTVFISSTTQDLAEYREAIYNAVEGLEGCHCIRMENFGARAWNADEFCRNQVLKSDLFIGIIGHFYGSSPPGSLSSFTEREYLYARNAGKPCLMFLASDKLATPDEEDERQRAFRARIKNDCIIDDFLSPVNLALRVVTAVRNWENEGNLYAPPVDQTNEPDLGLLAPKTCDRIKQEGRFGRYFLNNLKSHRETQQAFFLYGDNLGCHGSLIERFIGTKIRKYVEFAYHESEAVVGYWNVMWPFGDDHKARYEYLILQILEKVAPTYSFSQYDDTASAFSNLLNTSSLPRFIVIQHDIDTAIWDKHTPEVIKSYLAFWDRIKSEDRIPQFVIFFNVIFPSAGEDAGLVRASVGKLLQVMRSWRVKNRVVSASSMPRDMPGDKPLSPCVVLQELECVKRHEVETWFRSRKIGNEVAIRRWCDEIFSRNGKLSGDEQPPLEQAKVEQPASNKRRMSKCKSMANVESHLDRILKKVKAEILYDKGV